MIRKKPKKCKNCGKEFKPYTSLIKYCSYECNQWDKKSKPKKPKVAKNYGEKLVFEMITNEREHVSFISGVHVPCIAHNFAHVLAKGKYPKLRLKKDNIVLLSQDEHYQFDFGTEESRKKYADKMLLEHNVVVDWQKLYDYKEKLKKKYGV